jgi:phosphotransferase system enzyme I (PtsI)
MEIKKGIPISPGVAIGPAVVSETEEYRIHRQRIAGLEVNDEILRAKGAVAKSIEQIVHQREQVNQTLGRDTAAIFDWHVGVLEDPRLMQQIEDAIREKLYSAPHAVATVMRQFHNRFLQIKDPVIAQRERDVADIEKRLMRNALGDSREDLLHLTEDAILISHDLTPSQAVQVTQSRIIAIGTDMGGQTSHTAIVLKSLGLPSVMGLSGLSGTVSGGDTVIVDGTHGLVIVRPDAPTLEKYLGDVDRFSKFEADLVELRDLPAVTVDKERIHLFANIEFPHEAKTAMDKGSDGVGLYRTEFLYLRSDTEPSEEDHYQAYVEAIEGVGGREITIRTLDLGADKYTQSKAYEQERNPFLGLRSIRYCLQNLDVFKTQLRAILRASVKGRVRIMFPLIQGLMELRQAKMALNDAMEDLEEEGVRFKSDIPIGMMIETPAAVIQGKEFAREADFFSIGTNDLIQYTLAVDRANERVARLYNPSHPAVLRQLRDIIRAAHRADIEVSLCGEMAGQPMYTRLLLGFGLRRFSMAPGDIPEIKKIIRQTALKEALRIARKALTFETDRQVTNFLRDDTKKLLPPEAF